ncbi:MAG: tetraacyldisaccharide 4'-kinase [Selenomonadaceae bacterium]|nr:tetraacyldisaccharide 4'-kinase [Selenomonadaceae bacterium]
MQLLYNLAAILVVILIIPVFMIRSIRERGFVERIKQSFGFFPKGALEPVAKKNCIWVHAASVGEIVATSPLIKEFRREFPKSPILVSVVTTSGYEMANRIIKDADSIIYFPLDLPFVSASVFRRIFPRVFLNVETELWPNFLKAARENHVPVMMVNGRISEKSVKRYKYMFSILDDMISTVKLFAMASPVDAGFVKQLGAPDELVTVTGNTKFDQTYTDVTAEQRTKILSDMGLTEAKEIFLAGSTHRGEEKFVLKAFKAIRENHPNAKLVIAPRELLRTREVVALCKAAGFKVGTRTELQKRAPKNEDIIILDTIGELGQVYSIGDVIYVGGSLVSHGGHNILEPAAHGKAIIVGHHMENFKDLHSLFKGRSACITVNDDDELAAQAKKLFDEPEERKRLEQETISIVHENRGASRKSAVLLRKMLTEYEAKENARHLHTAEKIENLQTYFLRLIHDEEVHGIFTHIMIFFLYIGSLIYKGLVNLRLLGYELGFSGKERLNCFVISLGNITVGGTGKTPTAQRLAKEIRDLGYRVVILNRGYRAKFSGEVGIVSDGKNLNMDAAEAGDEAYMLAKHLPNVPVLIGARRAVTGQYAIENFGAEVVILDDGYQHWQVIRDLDILLVDAVSVFGNGHLLPRGTLRESMSHISRADVCLMTKVDQASDGSRELIRETVHKYNPTAQIVESIHQPRKLIPLAKWANDLMEEGIGVDTISGRRVMAVSAIGNPASFERTLKDLGAEIISSLRYPDHHDYTIMEMEDIMRQVDSFGAEMIIVTEKDAVKIPKEFAQEKQSVPVFVISVEVTFQEGGKEFGEMLRRRLEEKVGKR